MSSTLANQVSQMSNNAFVEDNPTPRTSSSYPNQMTDLNQSNMNDSMLMDNNDSFSYMNDESFSGNNNSSNLDNQTDADFIKVFSVICEM